MSKANHRPLPTPKKHPKKKNKKKVGGKDKRREQYF
jgi:hypothetical protein